MSPTRKLPVDDASLPTLDELLGGNSAWNWRLVKDDLGNISGCVRYGAGQKKIRVAGGSIDIAKFIEIDPKFGGAILKMFHTTSGKSVPHSIFVATKLFLLAPHRILPPEAFSYLLTLGESRYALALTDCVLEADGDLTLHYLNVEIAGSLSGAHYASNVRKTDEVIRKTWLDDIYPGWLERYNTGDSIGMERAQLASLVLPLSIQVEVAPQSLPDVLVGDMP